MKLSVIEKSKVYSILEKYDNIFPQLGDALSNTLQSIESDTDINIIDDYICSNRLKIEDKKALDRIFIMRAMELNF